MAFKLLKIAQKEIKHYIHIKIAAMFLLTLYEKNKTSKKLLTSKKIDVSRKRGAKEFLVGELESMLRATGVEAIFTTSNDAGLVNGLKKCGFEISDTNMVQMIKILK